MATPPPPDTTATTRQAASRAYLFLAVVMLFWSGNSVVGRAVRDTVPPFTLAFGRWLGALIFMAPWAIPALRRDAARLRHHAGIVIFLGLCGVASFNGLLYLALHFTTASNAILVQAAIPPMILMLNLLIFRERAPLHQVTGVALSTLGVLIVVCKGDLGILTHLDFNRGDLLVLAAVLGWALYTVLLRLKPPLEPISFLAVTFLVAAVAMAPLAAGEFLSGARIGWSPMVAGALLYVALLPSLVGYLLYNLAVGMIGAGRAGQSVALMPVFGALLAALLLHEPLRPYHALGMALVLAGIARAALKRDQGTASKREEAPAPLPVSQNQRPPVPKTGKMG